MRFVFFLNLPCASSVGCFLVLVQEKSEHLILTPSPHVISDFRGLCFVISMHLSM